MPERTERTVLNTLIVTCRDAERGFTWAGEHVKAAGLRTLFSDLAQQHHQYATDLLPHAQRLGGASEAEGSRMAALHRAWMSIKDRVAGDHDHALLVEAERGQRATMETFTEALNGMLPPETRDLVETQQTAVKAALDRLHTTAAEVA
jgi:uncharacterized protein (TIGR02284 family)